MTEDMDIELQVELYTSSLSDKGKRVDCFLAEKSGMTRSAVTRLIESGKVTVNGKPIAKNYKIGVDDCFEVVIPEPEVSEAIPEDIPIDVIYEDEDIIVVNKPQGMVVHPAPGNYSGTLVNALLYHCKDELSGVGGVIRPGIVHRIDKDTAGLLVVAKNDAAHIFLAEEIKYHRVSRIYYAIVCGNFKEDIGVVNAPIVRHPVDRKKMAIVRDADKRSREAVTHWSVVERYGRYTLVRCELETGRTHQIRVHMSSIGHALMGDPVYGGESTSGGKYKSFIKGQCLFAAELRLTHPKSREEMIFKAEFPENFKGLLEQLRKDSTID